MAKILIVEDEKQMADFINLELKHEGLDVGADDYLTKPFEIEDILARMRVILRRKTQTANQSKIIQVADLKLDLEKKQVSRNGKNIELTKKEYKLLEYLMKNNGIVISRKKIIVILGIALSMGVIGVLFYLRLGINDVEEFVEILIKTSMLAFCLGVFLIIIISPILSKKY